MSIFEHVAAELQRRNLRLVAPAEVEQASTALHREFPSATDAEIVDALVGAASHEAPRWVAR